MVPGASWAYCRRMTTVAAPTSVLSDELIESCGQRAATYDRENRFFTEDFEALRAAGYLNALVPRDLGGLGLSLAELCREQERLAYRAPATALAINMHVYWTGVACFLRETGDTSLDWIIQESLAGEVFAAGHAETGNDLPGLLSTARAERVDGGYRFWGHKMFNSLSPVWTRLGLHAADNSDPSHPLIIHAFLPREAQGYRIEETWDTLGMRATRSDDTVLEGAFVPHRYIARIVPSLAFDPFFLGLFAHFLPGLSAVYYGLARRAADLAIASARNKTSLGMTRSMAYHPEVQHLAAEMTMELEAMGAHLSRIADDWSNGVDHGPAWGLKLLALKHHSTESAKRVVDLAMTMSGGTGMYKRNELERLYRDVRCGGFHPANPLLVHELIGKMAFGIDIAEQPRWG
jgi:alkylation response protein AidB-like acyl-CoA dehydrogenase